MIDIVLYPVKVQGLGADKEISKGISFLSDYPSIDVIIVARGGGSLEDLEPFNSEIVANAVYNCAKPLVSAVGHETDFTIIDFVADLRAPTPSVASELVTWDKQAEIENIYKQLFYMEKILHNNLQLFVKNIGLVFHKVESAVISKISEFELQSNRLVHKLSNIDKIVDDKTNQIEKLQLTINNYNPSKISQMGYSKVLSNGVVVFRKSQLKSNDITISMIDGKIDCKVIN